VTGEPVPLPAGADLAAYRIIQESLTNTIRHAGPATAAVSVSYAADAVRIEVTDTGLGQPAEAAMTGPGSGGHGLAGMRERAAAVGGSVETGPSPGGGFRVTARLPLRGQGGTDVTPADPPVTAARPDPDAAATAAEEGRRP
jgi:signal transduction histidine kinase